MRIGGKILRLFGTNGCDFIDRYEDAVIAQDQRLALEAHEPDRQERSIAAASLLLQYASYMERNGIPGERELVHIVASATEAMGARLSPARPWLQPVVFTDPVLQRRQELAGAALYLLHHGEPFMCSPDSRLVIATIYGRILAAGR